VVRVGVNKSRNDCKIKGLGIIDANTRINDLKDRFCLVIRVKKHPLLYKNI
jgi:hypothetical protein